MKRTWLNNCLALSGKPASFYSGARKIHRQIDVTFFDLNNDVALEDAGYRRQKLTMLTKAYLHEESRNSALEQWNARIAKGKYGSVGFSCYNHLIKGHGLNRKEGSRASIMGPCIQSICLTATDKGETSVDIFYRTTEIFKKFPADLVLIRDVLLGNFALPNLKDITFYFANLTCHPMYFVTLIPHLKNPMRELETIKRSDKYFYDWIVKWTARYVCDEYHRGIAKFAQAMRTCNDARARIDKSIMPELQDYL
jgi:hypothetical protein